MDKYCFSYNQIHQTISKTADKILATNFEPDYILAIGAGGFIPARILRTYLKKPIITISIAYYDGEQATTAPKKLQWLDCIDISGKKILLVDEVDDTRATLAYCIQEILTHQPAEIAVFVLHNKHKPKKGAYPTVIKHIFVGEELSDKWIHYPWDALDIDKHDGRYNE